jgi:hypothetical protein
MPPQRRLLFPINRNTPQRSETDPYTRGKIAGLYITGLTQHAIINATNTSRKAVQGSICLEILNTNSASLPRPGQLVIYDPYYKRVMF